VADSWLHEVVCGQRIEIWFEFGSTIVIVSIVRERPLSRSLWHRKTNYRRTAHHIIQQTMPL